MLLTSSRLKQLWVIFISVKTLILTVYKNICCNCFHSFHFTFSMWIYFALCNSRILTCCIWSVTKTEWCFSTGRKLPRKKYTKNYLFWYSSLGGNTIMILLWLESKFSNEDCLQRKAEEILWRKDRAQPAASWVCCGAFMAASNMR